MFRYLSLLLLLPACASDSEFGPAVYRGPDRTQLFVSPHGEPFRRTGEGPAPMRRWFLGADADRDEALSLAEFRADADRWFAVLSGPDAQIDGFEVAAYERDRLPEMTPAPGRAAADDAEADDDDIIRLPAQDLGRRGRGGVNLDGAAPFGVTGEPHPVMAADFDQSRRIDAAEFQRASDERFRLLDKARDGRLAWAELKAIEPPRPNRRTRRPTR